MTALASSAARRYAMAVVIVAAAAALRLALDPLIGKKDILFAFAMAIVVASYIGGRGPGLLATALSLPVALYLAIEPQFSFAVEGSADIGRLLVLAAIGIGVSLFAKPAPRRYVDPLRAKSRFLGVPALRRAALIGGACAVLVALTSLLFADFERERERQAWVNHTYQVLVGLHGVISSVEDAEANQQSYVVTGDPRYLVPLDVPLQRERSALRDLEGMARDNPAQQERLLQLGRMIEAKFSLMQQAIDLKRSGKFTPAVAGASTGKERNLNQQCSRIMDSLEGEERHLLAVRTDAAEDQAKRMRWILGLGNTSLLLLLLIAAVAIERDIGQRQRAERTSELLTSIVTSSDDAIFSRDLDGFVLTWNQGAELLTGYSEAEAIGRMFPFFYEGGEQGYRRTIERLRAGERVIQFETKRTRKDGEEIEVSIKVSPLKLEGILVGTSIVARDITQRRRAERALALSEERYRSLVVVSNQIIWAVPPDGIVEDIPMWRDFTGQTVEHIQGWGWLDALHPDDRQKTSDVWMQAVKNRTIYQTEFRLRRKDGEYRHMAVHGVPVIEKDGRLREWVGSCADITERKQAEEQLRESRAMLEAALNSMTDALIISDLDGKFVQVNDEFTTYYRLRDKESLRSFADCATLLEVFRPDGTPVPVETWPLRRALRGETIGDAEYILRRKDTGESWVGSYSFGPIRDKNGEMNGALVVCRDVTARKQAEKALQQSEQRFRQIFENAPVGICIIDSEGKIEQSNPALCVLTGFAEEELRETWLGPLIVPEEEEAALASLTPFRASNSSGSDFRLVRKDGQTVWVHGSGSALLDANAMRLMVLIADITDRKRAEEAFLERERTLRRFTEAAPVALAMFDNDMRYLAASRRYMSEYHLRTEELVGRIHYEVFPEITERWREIHRRCLAGATERNPGEIFERGDGTTQWVRWEIQPWRHTDGSIGGIVLFTEDVTEQRRAEEALLESEERFRAFVTTSSDVVYRMSPDWTAMIQLHGRNFLTDTAAPDRDWLKKYIHPEDQPHVIAAIQEAIRTKSIFELEHRVLRADGSLGWTSSRAIPLQNGDGEITEWFGAARDITEYRHSEEALRESEQRFRTLANAIPQLCWIAKADGWIFWYNQRWYEYTGTTPEQMEGWGWQSVHDPDVLPRVLERWKGCIVSGEPFEMVFPLRAADGTFHPFLTRITPLRDPAGNVIQWFGTNTDITRQQQAQEELRQMFEQRQLALEAAKLGAWEYQLTTGKLIWDQRCRDIFGFLPTERVDYDTAMARIHADDRPLVEDALRRALAGEENGEYHPECRLVWPDGSIHWLLSYGRVYFNDADAQRVPKRFLGVNFDITSLKLAEEEVRKLNRNLEARVVERTTQWEAANKELEAFAYSVSHDLRAPLRAIDGFSRILLEEHTQELTPEAQRCFNVVRRNTLRMAALIDDLLAFSRMGRREPQKRTVDVNSLAREVFDELRGQEGDRCIEIAIAKMPTCRADPALLRQVLINLLSNALKYTRRRNPAKIEIGASAVDGDGTVYFVRDNGIGFDMRYVGKLFGVFERLNLSEEYEGTGVGLALVQRIISRHGGRVWAEGAVDQGATFYFTAGSATQASET